MRKDFRISGSGGQGVILLSVALAHAYGMGQGLEVVQTQSYGPEARGGACRAELVISDRPIDYVKVEKADVFVAFNQTGLEKYRKDVAEGGIVFVDGAFIGAEALEGLGKVQTVRATEIAEQELRPMTANMLMLGFLAARLGGLTLASAERAVEELAPASFRELNLRAVRRGYEEGKHGLV